MVEDHRNQALAEQGYAQIAQMIERLFARRQAERAEEDRRPRRPAFADAVAGE